MKLKTILLLLGFAFTVTLAVASSPGEDSRSLNVGYSTELPEMGKLFLASFTFEDATAIPAVEQTQLLKSEQRLVVVSDEEALKVRDVMKIHAEGATDALMNAAYVKAHQWFRRRVGKQHVDIVVYPAIDGIIEYDNLDLS